MITYRIIDAPCVDELETKVNALLLQGWSLVGGVSVILDRHPDAAGTPRVEWDFHQAMAR